MLPEPLRQAAPELANGILGAVMDAHSAQPLKPRRATL